MTLVYAKTIAIALGISNHIQDDTIITSPKTIYKIEGARADQVVIDRSVHDISEYDWKQLRLALLAGELHRGRGCNSLHD